jgi:ribosomal protein S18 acetylase RimI-like enzyme
MEDYKDSLIFDEYTISEVVNTNSDKLNFFFSYYFKDYSISKLNKSSDVFDWCFVAYKEDKIIGAIRGDFAWQVLHIDLLMVAPEYRKLGIGSQLYDLAINYGKKNNCTMATVETFDFQAPNYWESKGFKNDFSRSGYGDNILHFYSKLL